MEAIQGCRLAVSSAMDATSAVSKVASRNAAASVRPLGCQGFALSSRKFNPLVSKVPVLPNRYSSAKGVTTMSVEVSYASALAQLAKSKDSMEIVYKDVQNLAKYFDKPDVLKFFGNPTVPAAKKKEVLQSIAKEEGLQDYTLNFLYIIVDNRRMKVMNKILEKFEEKYYQLTDTEVAIVTSAVKIQSTQLAQIATKVQGLTGAKFVKIKNEVDPGVIAGFSVKYGSGGSLFLDLTVKGEFDRLTSDLEKATEAFEAVAEGAVA